MSVGKGKVTLSDSSSSAELNEDDEDFSISEFAMKDDMDRFTKEDEEIGGDGDERDNPAVENGLTGEYRTVRNNINSREKASLPPRHSISETASTVVNTENSSDWKGKDREFESFSQESFSRVACTFDSERDSPLGLHEK